MKNFIALIVLILSSIHVQAQLGFTTSYVHINAPQWEELQVESQAGIPIVDFKNGFRYSIDYWHKLKEKRIEFFPELSYTSFKSEPTNTSAFPADLKIFGFQYNVSVYPMDIEGDCQCPTFSKRGSVVKKGFFFQISPGVHLLNKHSENDILTLEQRNEKQTLFSIGFGAGLDLGINRFLTITPFARFNWFSKATWESLTINSNDPVIQTNETKLNQIYAGIRLGIQWKDN
ncbi:MAG TPA: hypothetical protein ENK52_04025 [Saprospiraceae bacterium]|nr:hypothetical protein [Saprospiraceae bacterium]